MSNGNGFQIIYTDAGHKSAKIFSWGSGLQGQLGIGTEVTSQTLPKELPAVNEAIFVKIFSAHDLSAAIDNKGKIYSWGKTKGMMAQDHRGFTSNLMTPTLLTFSDIENEEFLEVACGRTHMGAVTKSGKLFTWGSNDLGKLGLPQKKADPNKIRDYHPTNYADKALFGQVKGAIETKKIVQVACGFHHTLCLADDGTLFAWGGGKEGALGVEDYKNYDSPVEVF